MSDIADKLEEFKKELEALMKKYNVKVEAAICEDEYFFMLQDEVSREKVIMYLTELDDA